MGDDPTLDCPIPSGIADPVVSIEQLSEAGIHPKAGASRRSSPPQHRRTRCILASMCAKFVSNNSIDSLNTSEANAEF
jgi:hypothetical protein